MRKPSVPGYFTPAVEEPHTVAASRQSAALSGANNDGVLTRRRYRSMGAPPAVKPVKIHFTLFLALLAFIAAGCQNVKPWQRGTLADISMRPDRDPLGDALSSHVFFSREAAEGGQGVGGGGCGCN